MKIQDYFQELHKAVNQMGAKNRDFTLKIQLPKLDTIDTDLKEGGISVTSRDIEKLQNGLLSYKGRHVLLYIQDHGSNVHMALQNGAEGKKYHVAWCRTLKEMDNSGRYDRYVATNDISGYFYIDGRNGYEFTEGKAQLKVCKNCLSLLSYQGYDYSSGVRIFNNFSLKEFFESYKSHFKRKPKYKASQNKSTYTDDWAELSRTYRESAKWKCEQCKINLRDHKSLLHCHHINGVKQDNRQKNLKILCVECHSKEPSHNHMRISKKDRDILQTLRLRQKGKIEYDVFA